MGSKPAVRGGDAAKSYYEDHQKRLDDAIVAGWWGDDQEGHVHRQINHKGRIVQK